MKTTFYVDGFNFYFSSVQGSYLRWIDLSALFGIVLPKEELGLMRYFTAIVSGTATDPQKPSRQLAYIRALETIPAVRVHYGHFAAQEHWHPRASKPSEKVHVRYFIEKGSDVQLGSYLVLDAMRGEFEKAAVLSNDSDLAEPIRIVREELGMPVVLIAPPGRPNKRLRKATGDSIRHYSKRDVRLSQFPDTVTDEQGTIHKPPLWADDTTAPREAEADDDSN